MVTCMYPYTVNTVSKGPHKFLPGSSKSLLLVFPLFHLDEPILSISLVMLFFMTASRNIHLNKYLLFYNIPWRKSVNYGAGVPEQVWVMLFKTNSIPGIYLHVCITSLSNTLYETKCITNFTVWSLTNNTWKIKRHIFLKLSLKLISHQKSCNILNCWVCVLFINIYDCTLINRSGNHVGGYQIPISFIRDFKIPVYTNIWWYLCVM